MVEQKQEQVEESETFLKWCYVGDNQASVVIVMDSSTFEFIKKALDDYQKLKNYVNKFESDLWNGYPCPNWRIVK